MTKEIWKDVPGFEGMYQVSDLGNVKSLKFGKERLLKQATDSTGYLNVSLYKEGKRKGFKAHVLVAMAFLNHVPCGHRLVVDHIDNDKMNNSLDNLQVITNRENLSKDKKGGSSKYVGVSWSKRDKRWRAEIRINGKYKFLGYFDDEVLASEAYQEALKDLLK